MENFVFALNATMPLFLVILLGWFLRRVGLFNESFCKTADQYVFKAALPISLFQSVSTMDIYSDFDGRFCLFCALGTTVMFLVPWLLTMKFMKKREYVGAFSQAAVRSSVAVLGLALANNLYGNAGMLPMMIVAAVPLFNVYAVIILTFSPHVDEQGRLMEESKDGSMVKKAFLNVIKNPILLGILFGVPFALLRIELPVILTKALTSVSNTGTPIALLVVGASFSAGEAMSRLKPALWASGIKLFLLPLLFLPIAALLGFRDSKMIAVLIMVGSPTTVSCYVMAKQMKGDGVLSSNAIVLTTLISSVSLTFWIYLLRSFALI